MMELSFRSVDKICSQVDMTADTPQIDLSRITFSLPFGLVYLGQFLRYHNEQGKAFSVVLPKSRPARDYFSQQRFWERFNFSPEVIEQERLRRFDNETSLNDIVDIEKRDWIAEDIAVEILAVLDRCSARVDFRAVAEVVSELVDNFAQHSEYSLATLALQYYPNKHEIVIAVGDCGIGIRKSLCKNPKYTDLANKPHHIAALRAFEPLVSANIEGGMGLTEVSEQVVKAGGKVILATGDGYVIMDKQKMTYGDMSYDLCGVQIEVLFPEEVS